MQRVWVWVFALLAATSCNTTALKIDVAASNASPHADAGTGSTYLVGSTLILDGTGSFDPDGEIESYKWTLATLPTNASPIADPTASTTMYTLAVAGTYVFKLTVTDNGGATATSAVTIIAAPDALAVNPGPDVMVPYQTTVHLTGTYTVDPVLPVTIHWTLMSHPGVSSAVLSGADTLTPSFFADLYGSYVVKLTVSTQLTTVSATVVVTAEVPNETLNYLVVDVEYSTALDRFVIVSDAPPALHLHDPATATESVVTLSASPNAVSVEPAGLRAAVGHDGLVTVVNLQTGAIVGTYTVPIDVGDLVFAADGRVHCFGRGFADYPVASIDIAAGTVTNTGSAYGFTTVRMHPGNVTFYAVDGALSPALLARWDATATPVAEVRQGTDFTHSAGGNLWFTQDGFSIITPGGSVFYASDNSAVDMTYRLAITGQIRWAADSLALHKLAVTRTMSVDEQLAEFDDQTMVELQSLTIPGMLPGSFVAFRSDSSKIYVISKSPTVSTLFSFVP